MGPTCGTTFLYQGLWKSNVSSTTCITIGGHQRILKEQQEEAKVEEIILGNVEEENVTNEAILDMFEHCNVVELETEAPQFVEEKVKF
jgi:hypothetical protein